MTANGSSTVNKRPTRTGGRKTASKLSRFAGGADSAALLEEAKNRSPAAGGIIAGLASIAAADGQRFVEAPTSAIAPHPFNDPVRSAPQPDSARWTELVNSVRAAGVQVPILLVSRAAFVRARPSLEGQIGPEARYVIIYGHRRRAAAATVGLDTIPAVIDDAVLDDGGDLDAMTIENLAREDLSELQQAEMFAHYSEAGLGQRAIADKLGIHQSTVSRRLKLLLLTGEVLAAVENGTIKSTEAAELASSLPYGAPRPWQQETDPDQRSDERRSDQLAAYKLVVSGSTPKRAAERVLTERRARQRAAAQGLAIVDPRDRFGPDFRQHAIASPAAVDGEVVAAIDPLQGGLIYYPAAVAPACDAAAQPNVPQSDAGSSKLRAAAMKARRAACPQLVATPPSRDKLLPLLALQFATGLTGLASSPSGWKLAFEFSRAAGLSTAEHSDVVSYRAAAADETELKRHLEIAWACAVAGYELHASDKGRCGWNFVDATYLQILADRANYLPTPWERQRLDSPDSASAQPQRR